MAEQGDSNGAGGRWHSREIITEPGEMAEQGNAEQRDDGKLQALVYDILPSTTAVFSYAIGP